MTESDLGTQLSVITDLDETPFPWNIREGEEAGYASAGTLRSLGLLPNGTVDGRAAVMLHMIDGEGYNIVAQTTFRLLHTAMLTMLAVPWMQPQLEEDNVATLTGITDVRATDDPWNTPGINEWSQSVRRDMVPKLAGSALSMMLVTGSNPDIKLAVELGFAVLLNKPIIAVCVDGAEPSEKLRQIADEVVSIDVMDAAGSAQILGDALKRLVERGLIPDLTEDEVTHDGQ